MGFLAKNGSKLAFQKPRCGGPFFWPFFGRYLRGFWSFLANFWPPAKKVGTLAKSGTFGAFKRHHAIVPFWDFLRFLVFLAKNPKVDFRPKSSRDGFFSTFGHFWPLGFFKSLGETGFLAFFLNFLEKFPKNFRREGNFYFFFFFSLFGKKVGVTLGWPILPKNASRFLYAARRFRVWRAKKGPPHKGGI